MPNKDCPKLRECPLCGSEANIVGGPEDWHPTSYDPDSGGDPYSVVCTGCGCGMVLAFWDIDEAIKAWNNRAQESELPTSYTSTNADRIRSMSDEELASFLDEISGFQADYLKYKGKAIDVVHLIDWLRQPAKEETE